MHIAVIMPRWVGDAVMATPALRALRGHFPQARITGVMRPVIGDLLAGTAWLDEAIAYDRHRRDSAASFTAAVRGLRAARPDLAVILPNSLSSATLARVRLVLVLETVLMVLLGLGAGVTAALLAVAPALTSGQARLPLAWIAAASGLALFAALAAATFAATQAVIPTRPQAE